MTTSTSVAHQRDNLLSDPDVLLRLRRLNSATSSTNSLRTTETLPTYSSTTCLSPNDYPNDHKTSLDLSSDTSSVLDLKSASSRPFHVSKSLQVNTLGKKRISLPLASGQLEIGINELGVEGAPSGDVERYKSIRPERRKGNCTLFLQGSTTTTPGEEIPLAETTYRFGPGRPPVIKLFSLSPETRGTVNDEFALNGIGPFTRTIAFESKRFGKLRWRYASRKEKASWKEESGAESSVKSRPYNLLVLEKVIVEGDWWKGKEGQVVEVARMVRNDECRAVGTSSWDEGNGGRLEIDFEAFVTGGLGVETELMEWGGENGKREIEGLVVATVLVMLKKEIDRLRAIQIAVISGAVS